MALALDQEILFLLKMNKLCSKQALWVQAISERST